MPPPGVIRNPGPNLYETLYKPFDGPPYFLTPDVELPKHVEIWADRLFLAFTIIKHSPSPQFGRFVPLHQIVSGKSIIILTAPPHNPG